MDLSNFDDGDFNDDIQASYDSGEPLPVYETLSS
jgi:hypothetical protein